MARKHQIKASVYDKKGRLLSVGVNSYVKTHPVQKKLTDLYGNGTQLYLHAEVHALLKLKKTHKPYRIYIERYDYKGVAKKAKPCRMCQNLIDSFNIQVVEYTDE